MNNTLPAVEPLLDTLTQALKPCTQCEEGQRYLVGIKTGGLWVARELSARLAMDAPGEIDIGFHRDDFSHRGLKHIGPSRLDVVEGRDVVLVDDVLHTGRTIRAALNVLFEYGRPRSISLAVLVDRPGRQLPIQADYAGAHLDVPDHQRIKLRGPDALSLVIQEPEHG